MIEILVELLIFALGAVVVITVLPFILFAIVFAVSFIPFLIMFWGKAIEDADRQYRKKRGWDH